MTRGPISTLRADAAWSLHGLRALILENAALRAVILPEAGGRIYQITYKPMDADLLWNHPRIRPARLPFGSNYDDNWCGGMDELLPNNIPETINGEAYPDHGELWAAEWSFTTSEESGRVSATLGCQTRISDVYAEKRISLGRDESRIQIDYRLRKGPGPPLPVLWNLHVPFAVSEHHRLHFPSMKAALEPSFPGTLEGAPVEFTWPLIATPGGELDLSVVPQASARRMHFVYGHDFTEGRCGVTDAASGLASQVLFDPAIFRACWLFGSFGGWRNLNVALLEPSTGYPCQVAKAVEAGNCYALEASRELRTTVLFEVARLQ